MALDKPSKIKSAGVLILNKAADLIDYGLGYAKTPAEGLADQIETRMQAILDNHMPAFSNRFYASR